MEETVLENEVQTQEDEHALEGSADGVHEAVANDARDAKEVVEDSTPRHNLQGRGVCEGGLAANTAHLQCKESSVVLKGENEGCDVRSEST